MSLASFWRATSQMALLAPVYASQLRESLRGWAEGAELLARELAAADPPRTIARPVTWTSEGDPVDAWETWYRATARAHDLPPPDIFGGASLAPETAPTWRELAAQLSGRAAPPAVGAYLTAESGRWSAALADARAATPETLRTAATAAVERADRAARAWWAGRIGRGHWSPEAPPPPPPPPPPPAPPPRPIPRGGGGPTALLVAGAVLAALALRRSRRGRR